MECGRERKKAKSSDFDEWRRSPFDSLEK